MIMVCCIHEYTSHEKKILTRIAICFAIMFAAFSSMNYFVQFTAFRLSILSDQLEGLEQLIQWNPASAFYSINLLGWTLFLGMMVGMVFRKQAGCTPRKDTQISI